MVILITGASSGIGESAARRLMAAGHTVYSAARRTENMVGTHVLKMDLTDEKSIENCVKTVIDAEGHIDVLINNAGYGYFGALENVPMDEARRQFEVNVFGLARLCQLVLPYMRASRSGRIVNVASMAGHFCEPRGDWYHATKYSVVALSECLRMEVRQFGIKVSIIEPGAIRSQWCDIAMDHMEESSRGTEYEKSSTRHSKLFRWAYAHLASSPEVISRAIFKASTAPHPRLHYRRGMGSHSFIFFKTILPGRWFEGIMSLLFN